MLYAQGGLICEIQLVFSVIVMFLYLIVAALSFTDLLSIWSDDSDTWKL